MWLKGAIGLGAAVAIFGAFFMGRQVEKTAQENARNAATLEALRERQADVEEAGSLSDDGLIDGLLGIR